MADIFRGLAAAPAEQVRAVGVASHDRNDPQLQALEAQLAANHHDRERIRRAIRNIKSAEFLERVQFKATEQAERAKTVYALRQAGQAWTDICIACGRSKGWIDGARRVYEREAYHLNADRPCLLCQRSFPYQTLAKVIPRGFRGYFASPQAGGGIYCPTCAPLIAQIVESAVSRYNALFQKMRADGLTPSEKAQVDAAVWSRPQRLPAFSDLTAGELPTPRCTVKLPSPQSSAEVWSATSISSADRQRLHALRLPDLAAKVMLADSTRVDL